MRGSTLTEIPTVVIQLRLLGPIELLATDGRVVNEVLAQPKRLALLAYLAAGRPGAFHRRDTLLGMFWPELDQQRARVALNQAISFLRRGMGSSTGNPLVGRSADELGIDPRVLRCDTSDFVGYLQADRSQDALAIYRGDLMDGFFVAGAPAFQDWLDRERAHLRRLAAQAAADVADVHERARNFTSAVCAARRALDHSDLDERLLRHLLQLLDRLGDRGGAVQAYERFARRLATEYEIEPAEETLDLMRRIRCRVSSRRTDGYARAQAGLAERRRVARPLSRIAAVAQGFRRPSTRRTRIVVS